MTYRRFVGVALPEGSYFSTRDMFATGPLYFQSYLYANMIAAQLREAMRKEFGVEDLTREPRVAGWLTEHFFAMGGRRRGRRRSDGPPDGRCRPERPGRYLAEAAGADGVAGAAH